MDEQRKKIIVQEINSWKQTRMLPEHYCDYLLNLYTEGNPQQSIVNKKRFTKTRWLTLLAAGMLSLTVGLFYFTELSLTLQMTMAIIFGITSLVMILFLLSSPNIELIPLVLYSLTLLVNTIQGVSFLFPENPYFLYAVTAANCFFWISIGMRRRVISLKVSGSLGLLILCIAIFI